MSHAPATYKVISLFSGMGGMDIGFAEQVVVHRDSVEEGLVEGPSATPEFVRLKRLPFETVLQNDILPEAKRIAELNTVMEKPALIRIEAL
jgi:hypothetical protein